MDGHSQSGVDGVKLSCDREHPKSGEGSKREAAPPRPESGRRSMPNLTTTLRLSHVHGPNKSDDAPSLAAIVCWTSRAKGEAV